MLYWCSFATHTDLSLPDLLDLFFGNNTKMILAVSNLARVQAPSASWDSSFTPSAFKWHLIWTFYGNVSSLVVCSSCLSYTSLLCLQFASHNCITKMFTVVTSTIELLFRAALLGPSFFLCCLLDWVRSLLFLSLLLFWNDVNGRISSSSTFSIKMWPLLCVNIYNYNTTSKTHLSQHVSFTLGSVTMNKLLFHQIGRPSQQISFH